MRTMILFPAFFFVALLFAAPTFAATETIQTGVASPQSEAETKNIEVLRQRALRNAMDLALLQVTGATVNAERKEVLRSREDSTIAGTRADAVTRQQSSHNVAAATQTSGHARLVEIIKEWQEQGQYYVTARIAVDSAQEAAARVNAGHFWLQAGKPPLALSFIEEVDGISRQYQEDRTLRMVRDTLLRNGVEVVAANAPARYLIEVRQALQSQEMPGLGTTTVHCHLSYRITDADRKATVAAFKQSHGPDAGFSFDQAKERCVAAVAPGVAENLVRQLAGLWNQEWNDGLTQTVIIEGIPGGLAPRADKLLQDLHLVSAATPATFENGRLSKNLVYKGKGMELAEAVRAAFEDENWRVTISAIEGSRIRLEWRGTTEQ